MDTLASVVEVLLLAVIAYWVLETLVSRVFLRHVPKLPVRTDKTPPGKEATVVQPFHRDSHNGHCVGQVKVGGELWNAQFRGEGEPRVGVRVQVLARKGLMLEVVRLNED